MERGGNFPLSTDRLFGIFQTKPSYKRIWRLEGEAGGEQTHKRMVASLKKQIAVQEKKPEQVQEKHAKLKDTLSNAEGELSQVVSRGERICEEMDKFSDIDSGENTRKKWPVCKKIEKLKSQGSEDDNEEKERSELISKQYEAVKVKLGKIRFFRLERTVRFLHFKGRSTKSRRVPNLHNIREDFWNCTNTVNLLNFEQAMSSPSNKEQFLKQLESIVKGIVDNKDRECHKNKVLLSKLKALGLS